MSNPAPGKRVLVVEDEPMVRKLTVTLLAYAGFEAVAVADGQQALEVLEGEEEFDVVLSDSSMPGLSGAELLAVLRSKDIVVPFVLMSGYSDGRVDLGDARGTSQLAKPFGSTALLEAVESAIRAR